MSTILWSSGLGLGPDEVGQKGLKQLHLWRHSQKNETQNQNIFFIADADFSSLLRVWTAL